MLLSLILDVSSASAAWMGRPGALRALAYALVERGDPEVARALHDAAGGDRPFTVALLPEQNGRTGVRVTALNGATGEALLAATGRMAAGESLRFGNDAATVTGFTRDRPPLAQASDYVELAQARFSPRVGLRFVTPTVFKLADGRHLPLPEPDLMIQGWARRWNAFCPPDLAFEEALVASVAGRFALVHAALETSLVDLGVGKLVGFTGAATFLALRPDAWPGAERVAFAALTAFSRFCGTGVRTTQGFGLTLPSS